MKNRITAVVGALAVLGVVLITALTMTASRDTKKTISESIPHGPNERPVSK
jgi:hypothetical protein